MSGGRSHHDQRKKKKSSTLSDGAVLTDSHRSRVSLNWWFFFFMINFLILFFSLSLYCLLTKIKLSCFHQLQVCWFMGVNVLNKIKKSRWRKAESRKQDCVPFFSLPFDNEYCCTFLGGGGGSGNLSRFERCWFTFFFFFFETLDQICRVETSVSTLRFVICCEAWIQCSCTAVLSRF